MKKKRQILMFIFLLMLSNCVEYTKYIPDPEKDIEMWVDNFSCQRSFSYKYRLHMKSVYTEAQGDCVIGRGEHVCGVWHSSEGELPFEYIGLGDIEYSKKNGRWQVGSRGEQSNIHIQIKRLFEFDKFEYLGSEKQYTYRFKANIPFLAPGRWKEMIGFVKISKRKFLPEIIWAGLPDSSMFWETEIFDYNKKKSIKPPVKDWNDYTLTAARDYIELIKRRMKLIKLDYRVEKHGADVVLSVPKQYSRNDIQSMLQPGEFYIYEVVDNKEQALKIGYLHDDIKRPIFLANKILVQSDIKDVRLKFASSSKPYLEILLKGKTKMPLEVAVEIDSVIIGMATLDISKIIDKIVLYTDMYYFKMQIIQAIILQPLPKINFKTVSQGL